MTATAGEPTTVAPITHELGKPRPRKEDARLITGRSRYTDSITPAGTLYLHVVRSPLAHATITKIDTSGASDDARCRRRLHGGRPRRRGDRPALRMAGHPGPVGPATPATGDPHRALRR